MQPWGMLVATLLFFTFKISFTRVDLAFGAIMALSISLVFFGSLDFIAIRSISGYVSLFIISYTSFRILKSRRMDIYKVIKSSIIVWVAVGLAQTFFDKSFLSFMLPAMRSTDNRGVVGLAPEPTFYGVVLIFFILYLAHSDTRNRNGYIALCVFGIVFLAQSSMAVLLLLMLSLFLAVIYLRIKYIAIVILMILLAPMLVALIEGDIRILSLINMVITDPLQIVAYDASVNDRVFHIYFSLKGAFEWYFLPHGYSAWIAYATSQIQVYSDIVIVDWFTLSGRIMSGYGSAFFELGFFAALIPLTLTWLHWRLYRNDLKKFYFYALSVNAIMMTAIPIGFTLFAFYFALLNFMAWERRFVRCSSSYSYIVGPAKARQPA